MSKATDEAIDRMANAFLQWPLPESVCADLCATRQGPGRVGTNLLSHTEVTAMLNAVVRPELEKRKAKK